MKNRLSYRFYSLMIAAGCLLATASQAMAQIRNPDSGLPRLSESAVPSSTPLWVLSLGAFALVMITAFKNAKRNIAGRDE